MRVLLMGHPNVGKSAFFNRLTGANVIESNYPGTTVDYTKGYMRLGKRDVEVIDVPGTFSLEPKDKAEEVAVKMLRENKGAYVICVIDASKVERGLYLALEIIEEGYPVIIALNMWDVAIDKNVDVDATKLGEILGLPVVPTIAISGEGVSAVISRLEKIAPVQVGDIIKRTGDAAVDARLEPDERWRLIDKISEKTIRFGEYKHTLKDAVGDLTIRPLTGIPVAIAVLYGFWSIFGSFAGLCTDGFLVKIFDGHWLPWLQGVFPGGLGDWLYAIMVDAGHIKNGVLVASDNCFESFGVLTSGLFVPIGVVLPAIFIFYLMLTLLEDVGYMPRLAVLIDTVLHKIGLHGYAIVPSILALGCNVPAVSATRILETKKQRFMMMTLLAVFIPCGAQIGIMQDVIPNSIGFVMLYLFAGYFVFGFILNKVVPGRTPEILMDVPAYQKPTLYNVGRKVWMRTSGFLKVAVPFVLLGSLIVNILYLLGTIDWLGNVLAPMFEGWFGVPKETAGPLVAAFLRKDLAVAQLSAIHMTKYQMISAVVLVSIYFPCIATFALMLKEGGKTFLGSLAVLLAAVFTWGGLLHLLWKLAGVE